MPIFQDVLDSARTHLDDDKAINWQDYRLLPKLQEAYRELKSALILNGDELVREVSLTLTVPALTTDLTTVANYPTDLVAPIWLKEQSAGAVFFDFVDMTEVRFIPNSQQTTTLSYWAWLMNKIFLLGATVSVSVQIRYLRTLTDPSLVSASLDVTQGETYLSYRTAALALNSVGIDGTNLASIADKNLERILMLNSKHQQNLPAKRRPYHRRFANGRLWYF